MNERGEDDKDANKKTKEGDTKKIKDTELSNPAKKFSESTTAILTRLTDKEKEKTNEKDKGSRVRPEHQGTTTATESTGENLLDDDEEGKTKQKDTIKKIKSPSIRKDFPISTTALPENEKKEKEKSRRSTQFRLPSSEKSSRDSKTIVSADWHKRVEGKETNLSGRDPSTPYLYTTTRNDRLDDAGDENENEEEEGKKKQKGTIPNEVLPRFNPLNSGNDIENSAAQLFSTEKALKFTKWYHPDIVSYRLGMTNNQVNCICVVFPDSPADNNTQTFKDHLQQLVMLSTVLKRPALFISKEPGANNHFVCGLVKNNCLLLINPLGKISHQDCYQTLAELKEEKIIKEIWLSCNALQKKSYEEGLVSCGPITLELAMNVLENFTPEQLDQFWATDLKVEQPKTHSPSGLTYYDVNIKMLLPNKLIPLESSSEKTDYRNAVSIIRQEHYRQLQSIPLQNAQNLDLSVEDYLDGCKETDAQVVFNQLITGKGLNNIEQTQEFKSLAGTSNTQIGNRNIASQRVDSAHTGLKNSRNDRQILRKGEKEKRGRNTPLGSSHSEKSFPNSRTVVSTDWRKRAERKETNLPGRNPSTYYNYGTTMDDRLYNEDHENESDENKESVQSEYDFSYSHLTAVLDVSHGKELDREAIKKEYIGCRHIPDREREMPNPMEPFTESLPETYKPFYHVFRERTLAEKEKKGTTAYKLTKEQKEIKKKFLEWKLKFHISLPEDDLPEARFNSKKGKGSNYEKGWNIVQEILRKHGVTHFKIADNDTRMSIPEEGKNAPNQSGRDITIYVDEQKQVKTLKQWLSIVWEITRALEENHIPPGLRPVATGSRPLYYFEGNDYFSYRYECMDRGKPAPNPDEVREAWAELNHFYKNDRKDEQDKSNRNQDNNGDNDADEGNNTKCTVM